MCHTLEYEHFLFYKPWADAWLDVKFLNFYAPQTTISCLGEHEAEISQGSLQREMCESAECVFLLKEEDVKWGYTMWLPAWRHWGGSDFFENKWTVLGSPDYQLIFSIADSF